MIQKYDLEERTFVFAKNVIAYVRNLPKGITCSEIGKQLVRSAGSVGANYIEANESLSKKDFLMRIKICRKEAKESSYWLKLSSPSKQNENIKTELMCESEEIMKIFSAIMRKVLVQNLKIRIYLGFRISCFVLNRVCVPSCSDDGVGTEAPYNVILRILSDQSSGKFAGI